LRGLYINSREISSSQNENNVYKEAAQVFLLKKRRNDPSKKDPQFAKGVTKTQRGQTKLVRGTSKAARLSDPTKDGPQEAADISRGKK